jgi:hypothetical protein
VLALALAGMALHAVGPMAGLALAGAAALGLLALLTHGPLGISELVGRRLHHTVDLVLVAFLAVSPLIAHSHLDVSGVILVEAAAVVLLRVSLGTVYERSRPSLTVVDARSTSPDDPRPAARPPGRRLVERGAYVLGGAVGRARRPRGSDGEP